MNDLFVIFFVILGAIALTFGLSLLLAFPIMWLWNWLAVDLFQLPMITFWQAFGLKFLIHLLWASSSSSSSCNCKK